MSVVFLLRADAPSPHRKNWRAETIATCTPGCAFAPQEGRAPAFATVTLERLSLDSPEHMQLISVASSGHRDYLSAHAPT